MRTRWWSVPSVLACLAVSAHAEPTAAPVPAPAETTAAPAETSTSSPVPAPAESPAAPAETSTSPAGPAAPRGDAGPAPRSSPGVPESPAAGQDERLPIALAVNSPVGWLLESFGGSLYAATGSHHALRINAARYGAESVIPVLITRGEGTPVSGTMTDVGIGWIWYPRRLWDGLTFEVGVNRRVRDVRVWPDFDPIVDTESTTYAARALIGWSWKLSRHLFLAVAVGASVGREAGHETVTPEFPSDGMPTRSSFTRTQVDAESYWRLGWAFGG